MKGTSPAKAEPEPFIRMRALVAKVIATPKTEIDRQEKDWRKEREALTAKGKTKERGR